MFHHRGIKSGYGDHEDTNNCVKTNNNSHINQVTNKHFQHQSTVSFLKLFNPFSKSKSHTLNNSNNSNNSTDVNVSKVVKSDAKSNDKSSVDYKASVKVLKQFWNEQIKTAKSTENLYNNQNISNSRKSATIKYFSQSNDSINEPKLSREEKSLTLDGSSSLRLPLDDFNKFKDANFVRNKKIKLLSDTGGTGAKHLNQSSNVISSSRPESFTLVNDSFYPQVSSTDGGKIHWAKREDILTASKKSDCSDQIMSVKANKIGGSAAESRAARKATRSDSVASSVGSINSNTSSSLNSANRKFSFKTNPATTASYMNKKHSSNGGSKVAQLAQRFNQMVQQDATILEEVKKRGTVVVHGTGGRVFKIKEEKVDKKKASNDGVDNAMSDDAISLPSICGKNSTRKKSNLKKRPSIRIMVESSSSRKDGNGSVLSKRQLYETNIINKETIVLKPRVPDKSERVLAKTKELKSKKMNEILKTERLKNHDSNLNKSASSNKELSHDKHAAAADISNSCVDKNQELLCAEEIASEPIKDTSQSSKNNLRKIYDKITFRPTFLYGKKANKVTTMTGIQENSKPIAAFTEDDEAHDEINQVANKTADKNDLNEAEDELEFKLIDLNLNVFFNNENLSATNSINDVHIDDEGIIDENRNASSQGSNLNANEKPDHPLIKPNESFLFSRTLSATKFDTNDTFSFIRGMLEEDEVNMPPSKTKIDVECNASEQENSYEIISRHDDDDNEKNSECVDIDKKYKNKNKNDIGDGCDEEMLVAENEEENIYQSLCEVKGISRDGKNDDAISIKSYESFENYDEIKQNILDNKINLSDILKSSEDDYIFPDTSQPPKLPAPRKNTIPKISSPILTSTTSNLVQANDLPKLQKSNSCASTTYERIKYDQVPLKHQQQLDVELPLPPRNNQAKTLKYNENIYDTIRNSNSKKIPELDENKNKISCKEEEEEETRDEEMSMTDTFDINDNDNPYKNSKNDTMSIISNCYESISLKQSYSTINQILRHAISSTTLTSEHRINSIYGESMVGQSLTPPSDRSGVSDNSDEWIDVDSEEEEEEEEDEVEEAENNDRFIVICKKTKTHRSPEWSRLIRQKLDEWEVFVSSKSYIYITAPNNESKLKFNDFDTSELPSSSSLLSEPIYENIENFGGSENCVVALADDSNKCTIYVNYDFINGEKSSKNNRNKSSVRLLEPDVKLVHMNEDHYFSGNEDERQNSSEAYDDNDEENNNNNGKSMSKMIQCQQISMYIDDSDHHYESLYSIQQQRAALEGKLENGEKPLGVGNNISSSNGSNPNYLLDKFDNDDDYSSFESDDDNSRDGDLEGKTQPSDVHCPKLPDPPQSTGQVYAFVQRIKNFGSISRNEISKGISKIAKKRSSLAKMPTSKFYETCDIPEDTDTSSNAATQQHHENEPAYIPPLKYETKSLGKKSRGLSKLSKLGRLTINKLPTNFSLNESESDYHQTSKPANKGNNENHSSLNLSENVDVEFLNQKNNKSSFTSKFRKSSAPSLSSSSTSNIYGSLASKKSTFYVTDSVDVDSGIFAVNEKSTSSPDNSNLNLSSTSNSKDITCDPKRRSIASLSSSRPKDSPPPPPSEKARRSGSSSWYAECGLFKSGSGSNIQGGVADEKGEKIITSWYQESGLYQTSNNSVASSSGSSGVSTGGECSPCGDENSHSMFLNEPLYQLYTAAKLESISSSEFEPETESDGYEEVHKKEMKAMSGGDKKQSSRPSALQLIEPNHGPSRTLWSEVPEVIQSGMLTTLTTNEKRLQEAKFEILTSEASYLKSLNLLKSHFMNHPAFRDHQHLDPQDRKTLFSYIIPVQECSDRLLCDLEACWQDSIMLKNLAKHIFKHAEKNFHVYISYCEHQGRLDRTLRRLKEIPAFKETLDILENDSICCGLTIHSFLMLPMQRITRLPLLIDAVMTKLKSNNDEFDDWKMAMAIANKVVDQCNQAANRCEQAFEMETLSKQIEFQQNITPFPLIPFINASGNSPNNNNNRMTRTLVRRGELVHIIYRGDDAKLTFGKKATIKKNIYCFLFTDVLILTKKKSEESFIVFDYCQRSLLQLSSGDVIPQFPPKDINQTGKYIIFMSLLENHAGKPVDLILACPSETERQRWLQATAPPTSENPHETLYEQWDCPQVVVKHSYQALEPDELMLDVGDVVNVLRKMKDDGWYFGERIRDGSQGWFPGNHSEEVHSAHVRARNLKQRHRLLLYTATYLEAQKDANVKRK